MGNMYNKAFQVQTGGLLQDGQIVHLLVWFGLRLKLRLTLAPLNQLSR